MARKIKNPTPAAKKRGRPKQATVASSSRTTRLSTSEGARKTRSSSAAKQALTVTPTETPTRRKTGGTLTRTAAGKGKTKGKGKGEGKASAPKRHRPAATAGDPTPMTDDNDEPSYWLLKSEPESRLQKGVDVKFSLDDLEASEGPVAWDGVRNPTARNNMRAMSKGDLAFFYHSNCKVPGIVGVAEVVGEHSVDESAHDPTNIYYDSKSSPASPKWSVVHVVFKKRFSRIVPLRELQMHGLAAGALGGMQALKQLRLSVSKVTKEEWDFITGLAEKEVGGGVEEAVEEADS